MILGKGPKACLGTGREARTTFEAGRRPGLSSWVRAGRPVPRLKRAEGLAYLLGYGPGGPHHV